MHRPQQALIHMQAVTHLEGWLTKSHAGQAFRGDSRRRYFVSSGFHCFYYTDDTKKAAKGHFDWRNVVEISPVSESIAPDAIKLCIAEKSSRGASMTKSLVTYSIAKTMVISFSEDAGAKQKWLTAWCSAVCPQYVDEPLQQYISAPLSARFNMTFGSTRGVGSKRSLLRKATPTAPLTPRDREAGSSGAISSSDAEGQLASDAGRVTEPDTPRAQHSRLIAYEATVPDGAVAGDKLRMSLPGYREVQVCIPPGAVPGSILTFELPEVDGAALGETAATESAAVRVQAHMRGSLQRKRTRSLAVAAGTAQEATLEPITSPGLSASRIYSNLFAHHLSQTLPLCVCLLPPLFLPPTSSPSASAPPAYSRTRSAGGIHAAGRPTGPHTVPATRAYPRNVSPCVHTDCLESCQPLRAAASPSSRRTARRAAPAGRPIAHLRTHAFQSARALCP